VAQLLEQHLGPITHRYVWKGTSPTEFKAYMGLKEKRGEWITARTHGTRREHSRFWLIAVKKGEKGQLA